MSTYRELYLSGRQRLVQAGIENAEEDSRALLLHAAQISLNELLCMYDMQVKQDREHPIEARFNDMIESRCGHMPLQYITHVQNFCGFDMYVDEHVLIPRQDTEVLVEKVLDACASGMRHKKADSQEDRGEDPRLLDLCTGSGCIAIALKKLGCFKRVDASDISPQALDIAKRNAQANAADITFIESDLFKAVPGRYDVIVSNPPYIPRKAVEDLAQEVRCHEPRLALEGKEDGLYYYRRIVGEAGAHLCSGGGLFLEIGYDQADALRELLAQAAFEDIEVTKDLAGLDRVVSAIWRKTDA